MRQAAVYNCALEGLSKSKFYVGNKGKLPKVGDPVTVADFFDGTVHHAQVVKVFRDTLEYRVTPEDQPPLFAGE